MCADVIQLCPGAHGSLNVAIHSNSSCYTPAGEGCEDIPKGIHIKTHCGNKSSTIPAIMEPLPRGVSMRIRKELAATRIQVGSMTCLDIGLLYGLNSCSCALRLLFLFRPCRDEVSCNNMKYFTLSHISIILNHVTAFANGQSPTFVHGASPRKVR